VNSGVLQEREYWREEWRAIKARESSAMGDADGTPPALIMQFAAQPCSKSSPITRRVDRAILLLDPVPNGCEERCVTPSQKQANQRAAAQNRGTKSCWDVGVKAICHVVKDPAIIHSANTAQEYIRTTLGLGVCFSSALLRLHKYAIRPLQNPLAKDSRLRIPP
jgi:hypothetical protein